MGIVDRLVFKKRQDPPNQAFGDGKAIPLPPGGRPVFGNGQTDHAGDIIKAVNESELRRQKQEESDRQAAEDAAKIDHLKRNLIGGPAVNQMVDEHGWSDVKDFLSRQESPSARTAALRMQAAETVYHQEQGKLLDVELYGDKLNGVENASQRRLNRISLPNQFLISKELPFGEE
jgi:hypothetical protein